MFSSMWACRGSCGDLFLMGNSQYHWALNWEGRVKKVLLSTHLASSGGSLHVLKCLISYSAETVTYLLCQRSH